LQAIWDRLGPAKIQELLGWCEDAGCRQLAVELGGYVAPSFFGSSRRRITVKLLLTTPVSDVLESVRLEP